MKFALLLLLSISSTIFAQKLTGQVIKASDFNSSSFHIGSIQQSILSESQFQNMAGTCWVQMKGQSIVNSDLAALGITNLPDARGTFIKVAGINENHKKANGSFFSGTLNTVQNDSFQGHWHDFYVGNTANSFPHLDSASQLATADNAGGRSLNSTTTANKNIINAPKSDTVNGTPRVGSETQPANLSLNTFIKINKNCN